jgi:mannose-1-phosphate guanylyltransferase/mannose-6-phosphate isomerase
VFKAGVMKDEIGKYNSEISEIFKELKNDYSNITEIYGRLPNISIDYAVMENTDSAAVVSYEGVWNDLGSWESVLEVLAENKDANFTNGDGEIRNSNGSFFYTEPKKLVAAIGVEDVIAIDTQDALLVVKKGEGQGVKDIVNIFNDRPEVISHLTDYRPWGGFRVLENGDKYKVKILEVNPGHRLSLQKHKYRDEVWTIMEGEGFVTLGDKSFLLKNSETIEIQEGTVHRVENKGDCLLKILEFAKGEIISEDDIVRIEDDYDRTK